MPPLLLAGAGKSLKKETGVVLVSLGVILFLPLVALSSITDLGALASNPSLTLYTGNASKTNTYDFGYCTFWAAKRREEVGVPIPNTFGNANTWDDRAPLNGYTVDQTPAVHSIMQSDAGELGHVAFVESVGQDGSWTVSEMNVKGWDIISSRTFTKEQTKYYKFIH